MRKVASRKTDIHASSSIQHVLRYKYLLKLNRSKVTLGRPLLMGVAMRINKLAAAILLGISALGLSACATGLRTQVSRYQAMPAPQGQSFVVVPQNPSDVGGLEFSRYAENVAQMMEAQGYARAPSINQATMVVQVGYGVSDPQTEVVSYPSYGYGYGWGYPYYYGRRPYYWGWADPFWGLLAGTCAEAVRLAAVRYLLPARADEPLG